MTDNNKEPDHGPDRQAGAHHPNPQASGSSFAFTWPSTLQVTYTFSTSSSTSYQVQPRLTSPAQYVTSIYSAGVVGQFGPMRLVANEVAADHVLPASEETMPILAKRAASIAKGPPLSLHAVCHPHGPFAVDADARCFARRSSSSKLVTPNEPNASPFYDHPAPCPECSCGFYGVLADGYAQHCVWTVELEVEFSGTVIVHESGYRAEHQRVLAVHLPQCPCGDPSTWAASDPSYNSSAIGNFLTMYTCAAHASSEGYTIGELAELLDVPIYNDQREWPH
jgi:hypothetical protein